MTHLTRVFHNGDHELASTLQRTSESVRIPGMLVKTFHTTLHDLSNRTAADTHTLLQELKREGAAAHFIDCQGVLADPRNGKLLEEFDSVTVYDTDFNAALLALARRGEVDLVRTQHHDVILDHFVNRVLRIAPPATNRLLRKPFGGVDALCSFSRLLHVLAKHEASILELSLSTTGAVLHGNLLAQTLGESTPEDVNSAIEADLPEFCIGTIFAPQNSLIRSLLRPRTSVSGRCVNTYGALLPIANLFPGLRIDLKSAQVGFERFLSTPRIVNTFELAFDSEDNLPRLEQLLQELRGIEEANDSILSLDLTSLESRVGDC
ncbi:MAG: hypothetical protein AAF488_08740 [Planctomycetota bacterium]